MVFWFEEFPKKVKRAHDDPSQLEKRKRDEVDPPYIHTILSMSREREREKHKEKFVGHHYIIAHPSLAYSMVAMTSSPTNLEVCMIDRCMVREREALEGIFAFVLLGTNFFTFTDC